MYIVFFEKDELNGGTTDSNIFCGYIQVDNEKPMKIRHVRCFKLPSGFHTIKYTSDDPSGDVRYRKTVSQTFGDNDLLRITVNAGVYRVYGEPSFDILDMSPEVRATTENMYDTFQNMIKQSYYDAKSILQEKFASNPHFKSEEQKYMDFLETVDLRCSLASYEVQEFAKRQQHAYTSVSSSTVSTTVSTAEDEGKSTVVELVLCLLLGWLGAHRFYREKYLSGVLYLFSFGFSGFGILIDAIILIVRLIKNR